MAMAIAIDRRQSLFLEMDNAKNLQRALEEHVDLRNGLISGMGFFISCLSLLP
jgi:hypothetical protein